jgi:hypothetical protein
MTFAGEIVRSAFLHVTIGQDEVHLSPQKGLNRFLGLRLREGEVNRRIAASVRHVDSERYKKSFGTLVFRRADIGLVREIVADIDNSLRTIASRPLTPRLVQDVLGITARERLRWTKDGRLPTKGVVSFRRGQSISVRTYAPESIAKLLSDPGTIASWRAVDAKEAAAPLPSRIADKARLALES